MTDTARPQYLPTTEVAKIVRTHLRRLYDGKGPGNPDGWRYSVRSDSYAGGSAVRVTVPKDYPREAEQLLYRDLSSWGSSGFDGMTDSSYTKGHAYCSLHGITLTHVAAHWGTEATERAACCERAVPVHVGASYVTVSRDWR
jgi:hypothetical protein